MSRGSGDFMHKVLFWQTLSPQHSLSAQSTRPSIVGVAFFAFVLGEETMKFGWLVSESDAL